MRPRLTCPHCGEDVERLPFCGNCGRRLQSEGGEEPSSTEATGAERLGPDDGAAAADGRGSEGTAPDAPDFLGRRGRLLWGRWRRRPTVGAIRLAVVVAAALLALVALLADEPGWALVAGAVVGPALIVDALLRRDVFDRLPPLVVLVVAVAGIAAGVIVGGVGIALSNALWLNDHPLDIASLGFGARAAEGDPSPPLLVMALNGLVLPAVGMGAALAAPLYLRRWPKYRNEVMDGVTLGGAAGGGYAIGFAIAVLWRLIAGESVGGDVPEWTAAAIGVVVLRPLILVGTTVLVGAAIWKYDLTGRSADLLAPLAAGLGLAVAYAFVSLLTGDWSPAIGLVWSVGVLVAVAAVARPTVAAAIRHDRRRLTPGLVVCPRCRSLTPAGAFCSVCRQPLSAPVAGVTSLAEPSGTASAG